MELLIAPILSEAEYRESFADYCAACEPDEDRRKTCLGCTMSSQLGYEWHVVWTMIESKRGVM